MPVKEKLKWKGLSQIQRHHSRKKAVTPGMPELLRSAAAQGAVLLENKVLPLEKGTRISLFGRVQLDWFCTGYGSGGDVNAPYRVGLLEGLRRCEDLQVNEDLARVYEAWVKKHPADHGDWGKWPMSHPEMPVPEELAKVARECSDQAVVVIGRASGEERESTLTEGSYYLTHQEQKLLKTVTEQFPQAVLILNIGSVMDLSFLDDYSFGAVLIAWQGGMESGNAVADLLCGKENPSGRLTDTIAHRYEDCPTAGHFGQKEKTVYFEDIYVGYRYFETFATEKVRYPFGHGLSYTTFSLVAEPVAPLRFRAVVTNTGHVPGRETVLLYVSKPEGRLNQPARELAAFGKTKQLQPGEQEILEFSVTKYQLSSYDDSGITGHKSCYVLQGGTYRFYCGGDVRSAALVGEYRVRGDLVWKQLTEAAAPGEPFDVMTTFGTRPAPQATRDLRGRILENLPSAVAMTGNLGYRLRDVAQRRIDLNTFLGQLDLTELEAISRGAYVMGNPLGAKGNAGVFGGVTSSLRKKGIPPITTTDGPSGIRLYDCCSLLPIGTLLACTFDTALVEEIYRAVGGEMRQRGSQMLLAPGMNIHRDPLCGRNFEYFSEDPYVTGRMAGAVVKGLQSQGVSACPKHFACNNQETNRNHNDSLLTERALREIYLKGFEICIKQARPLSLMTSYNQINGVWGHYHYDLVRTILREEWGYQGLVITDWWMQYRASAEFPGVNGNGYRVRSRVDVLMPGSRNAADRYRRPDGTLLDTLGKPEGITLGEIQEAARNVLRFILAVYRE